jgi:MYXO-CTERM domain-containing protein
MRSTAQPATPSAGRHAWGARRQRAFLGPELPPSKPHAGESAGLAPRRIRYRARMRLVALAPLLAATTLVTTAAIADLGPPPKCGTGTHHEYLYGHRCVPDGSHLERDPAGGVKTVPDNAAASPATPPASPAPTTFASPPSSASAAPATDPAPVPTTPPASRGCACGVAEMGGSAAGALAGVAALAALLRRYRSR